MEQSNKASDILEILQREMLLVFGDIQAALIKDVQTPSIITNEPNLNDQMKQMQVRESSRKLQVAADHLTSAIAFAKLAAGDIELYGENK